MNQASRRASPLPDIMRLLVYPLEHRISLQLDTVSKFFMDADLQGFVKAFQRREDHLKRIFELDQVYTQLSHPKTYVWLYIKQNSVNQAISTYISIPWLLVRYLFWGVDILCQAGHWWQRLSSVKVAAVIQVEEKLGYLAHEHLHTSCSKHRRFSCLYGAKKALIFLGQRWIGNWWSADFFHAFMPIFRYCVIFFENLEDF